jgi:hypothetical protein
MECFYRNETLHKSEPIRAVPNDKPLDDKELAWGMAYARHHLEGMNSLFEGWYNVFTYPSQSNPDCRCAGGSRLRRLQPLDQSKFLQSEASPADVDDAGIIYVALEWHQGSRC